MHTLADEYSGRPVAADAWTALKPFREAGSRSFENFEIPVVRERYIASCAANGLDESPDAEPLTRDFEVGAFQVRVYDPRPATDPGASLATPAVLFIHGGGWLMGNLETHHSSARRLAVQTGFPVVAVDYRLAPEARYPAAMNDCREALRWLHTGIDEHSIEISGVCVLGDSAGGQMAAVLANEAATNPGELPVFAQVLLYPITDCSEARTTHGAAYRRIDHGFPLTAHTMRWFIDTYLPSGQDRTVADLSPLLHDIPAGSPQSLVITVDNDPLSEEGAEYAAKQAISGVDVTYRHLSGYHHGLFTSAGVIARGEAELSRIARWIRDAAYSSGLPQAAGGTSPTQPEGEDRGEMAPDGVAKE